MSDVNSRTVGPRILSYLLFCLALVPALSGCEKDEYALVYNPEAVSGIHCEVSSPDEWVIGKGATPGFSYHISNRTADIKEYCLEITASSPDNKDNDWSLKLDSDLPPVGGDVSGQLVASFVPPPGFYICRAFLNGKLIRRFNIVCDPEEYAVADDRQEDFEEFWNKALDDLASVEMNPEMALIKTPLSESYNTYNVVLHSAGDFTGDDVEICGRYVEPVGGDNLNLQIMYIGYDDPDSSPFEPIATFTDDTALLVVYSRGQGLSRMNGRGNKYGEWVTSRLGSPADYYYRGAYLDAVRTVEFAYTLPHVDKSRIYAIGGSQGGALALAAAALAPGKLRFISVSFPFMGNFPTYLETAKWPADKIKRASRNQDIPYGEALRTLSYFDTKNLAGLVTCPVLLQISLQDETCPPWTQAPIIANLPDGTECQWTIYPESTHAGDPGMNQETAAFAAKKLSE